MEQADTGDLLLFKCKNFGAFITRSVTWSEYDHVAMILKFESTPNEIYLVEATGNTGVALNKWSSLRKHVGTNKFYRKCVYRHLDLVRGQDVMEKLESFLQQAVGLEYGLSVRDIAMRRTTKTRCSIMASKN